MRKPTYAALAQVRAWGWSVSYASGSPAPQGNPRHYKYLWQVFSEESPWQEAAFFEHAPVLCNADFRREVQRLADLGLTCLVYGFRRPRNDPANPWDLTHARWQGWTFAPAWDDDTDPPDTEGHK